MSGPASIKVTLTPFTCGRLTLPIASLMDGRSGDITVPVPAYLISHPTGLALFDTGVGPRFARQAGEARSGPIDLQEDELIDARLRAVGVDPMRVGYILNSHLHWAYAGGNALLPAASVIVQQVEWEQALASSERDYHAPEFDTGQPVVGISGRHDVFGDGSVVLVPTPGHTLGHQSARIRTSSGEVVLAGDTCRPRRSLNELVVTDHADDLADHRASLEWCCQQQRAGATIACGHEPDF